MIVTLYDIVQVYIYMYFLNAQTCVFLISHTLTIFIYTCLYVTIFIYFICYSVHIFYSFLLISMRKFHQLKVIM